MNICIFGDSVAKGVVYDEARGKYIFSKEGFVNLFCDHTNIEVKNFSKFGCTIAKGTEILEKQAEVLPEYDYTVLEFGGNDCDLDWPGISANPDAVHPAQVPIDSFRMYYEKLIDRVRSLGSKPVMLTLPPLDAQRFFDWVSRGLDTSNILGYLGNDVQFIYRWHQGYDNMIREIAGRLNVPLIDIRTAFLTTGDYRNYLCADGMHPNAAGHRLIEAAIEATVPSFSMDMKV